MVACVEGELHDFPAHLVADVLDVAGYDVVFAGANVPTEHFVHQVVDDRTFAALDGWLRSA